MNAQFSSSTSVAALAAGLLFVSPAAGQSSPPSAASIQPSAKEPTELDIPRASDPGKQPFLRYFVQDEWRIWSSPFRASSYDSKTVKKYVIPAALISAALFATDRHIANAFPNTTDQTTWSGRISQIGAPYTLAGGAGVMYLIGRTTGNKRARETGWLGMEAIAHSQIIIQVVKQITNRQRPISDQARAGFWTGGDSFPSGHATSSFALATVFAYEYRDHIAVPIVAYSLATVVAASRTSARRHWVSDVFVGGSMGFLVGRYVYKQRHDPRLPGSPVNRGWSRLLKPEVGFSGTTFSASWQL